MSALVRNLVTGGAGFLGSHLVDRLMHSGEKVICLDNFSTGRKKNVLHWISHPRFQLINHDVIEPVQLEADRIWHLACPASPMIYQRKPIETSKINFLGTFNMLGLAKRLKAKFLLASSSEVYGDPEVHPQPETYRGCVNNTGVRSCYDEGKRIAESLCYDYYRMHKLDIRIARIFNTYGPRMLLEDGRVLSNFIVQALSNKSLTIYGNGKQTRSFCYVDDLMDGLVGLMNSNYSNPINLGNTRSLTIHMLSQLVRSKINENLEVVYTALPQDDPRQRQPLIALAKNELDWEPKVSLEIGLDKTIRYFRDEIDSSEGFSCFELS